MRDTLFRILRNSLYLISGKGFGGLILLAAMALAARAMGPAEFGALMLVHAYVLAASGLAKFQSWQAIVQFGAAALRARDAQGLSRIVAFGVFLDAGSGLLVGAAAAALLPLLGPRVGLTPEQLPLALIYCTIIPTMTAAAPTGVMRLLDRFRALGLQSLVTPAIRLAGVALVAALDGPFWAYAAVWWISDLAGDIVLWALAIAALRSEKLLALGEFRLRALTAATREMWRFVFATNVSSSIALALGPLSNLIVGGFLGPAAAGGYRLALTLVEALGKPADLVTRSFYPELAHLRAAGDSRGFTALGLRAAGLMAPLALALVLIGALVGPWVLSVTAGQGYSDSAEVVRILSLSLIFLLPSFPADPMMVALGRAGWAMNCRIAAAAIYLAALVLMAKAWALDGVGWAYVLGAAVLSAIQVAALALANRRG